MIDHKQIIDHYIHACNKHPHFCKGLLTSNNIKEYNLIGALFKPGEN